jgi:F-box protein 9
MDPNSTEAELENFRRRWREEVSSRTKGKGPASATPSKTTQASSSRTQVPRSNVPDVHRQGADQDDEAAPHSYHDLGEKRHGRRLDETNPPSHDSAKEPNTALEHYEKAVEREGIGSLGDSVDLYRKAYRVSYI